MNVNKEVDNAVIADAERCRREARAAVEENPGRYAELKEQPSAWCVVTQKRFGSPAYHNCYGEAQLRECLHRGHKVLLTVGIVARPHAPLSPETHLAIMRVPQPGKVSEAKLQGISARAKLRAAQALLD